MAEVQRDPYHLETLHPGMWKNIQFLRKLADELEFGNRFNWHGSMYSERLTKGRKYEKFTGETVLTIRLQDSEIVGESANDDSIDWPDWW
jgi:hypothetical protein